MATRTARPRLRLTRARAARGLALFAGAALAPAAALAGPAPEDLVPLAALSAGDTAWMLTATALVLMMTLPGTALFYGGMVRKKNVLATLMQSFAIAALVTLLWWLVGYSLALTPGSAWLGGLSRVGFRGMSLDLASGRVAVSPLAPHIPETVYSMFQLSFAIVTVALICGSVAERMKFTALCVFATLWTLIVYLPVAHWVWAADGWLAARGVLDYAGGTVVHVNAGVAGLAGALVLGRRLDYGRTSMAPHNLVLTVVGAGLLWMGWFGFNAGSAGAADARAGMAMLTTQFAAAAAAVSWIATEWWLKHKPSVLGVASGAVAGLVAITPACGFVGPGAAVLIGLLAGVVCFFGASYLKQAFGYDDTLDAFGVHGIGGMTGALLTGVLAEPAISGQSGSLGAQALAVGVTALYGFTVSFVLLKILDRLMGLRVSEDEEREGLDIALHGESIE